MNIKLPKNHIRWVTIKDAQGTVKQIITSDELRRKYYLYNVSEDGSLTKIETNNSPIFDKSII
jgi:hypothetical protein